MPVVIMEAAVIASSLSLDAFSAGLAYGGKKISIPIPSIMIINLICSTVIGLSLLVGSAVRDLVPPWISRGAAFSILFIIGAIKLLDSLTKSIIKKHTDIKKEFKLSMFNFKFILSLYACPEDADIDASHLLSLGEAAVLALSLSLDGIAAGIGIAFANVNIPAVLIFSLITDIIALKLGHMVGTKIADTTPFNISWLGGAVLIVLAVSRLF